ncbi:hypothetical protein NQZ68_019028 [Dissostichus eleginoides]|nr:hypothetical protein NQZ68_019028 [Dissostichus eleginoides]
MTVERRLAWAQQVGKKTAESSAEGEKGRRQLAGQTDESVWGSTGQEGGGLTSLLTVAGTFSARDPSYLRSDRSSCPCLDNLIQEVLEKNSSCRPLGSKRVMGPSKNYVGSPAQIILVIMEPNGTNVWGGGGVKHAGVSVYPMATAGMQPLGKVDIPQSRAEAPCPLLVPLPPVPDEPLLVPADCRFPDKSFSTAARFPVRAASRSSCSFPIADPRKNQRRRGEEKKKGGLVAGVKFFSDPSLLPISSYSSVLLVWRGNKSSLRRWFRPSRSTVPLLFKGGKFRSAARYHHQANFL